MTNESDKDQSSGGLPLRRLQLAINQIMETSIPFNLNAIERHKQRIEEFRVNKEWDQMIKEQSIGLQTVQRLKADLRQLECLTKKVMANDWQQISEEITPIRAKVDSVVKEFLESNQNLKSDPLLGLNFEHNFSEELDENYVEINEQMIEKCSNVELMTDIMERKQTLLSWLNLRKELNDLNHTFHSLLSTLSRQKESVNSIENNISNANENVLMGAQHLSKASALKSTFVPITAGLLGGAVFGPIGALAGFKFSGIAAALGASVVTYSGVKFIQKKSITDEEMEIISNETNTSHKPLDKSSN